MWRRTDHASLSVWFMSSVVSKIKRQGEGICACGLMVCGTFSYQTLLLLRCWFTRNQILLGLSDRKKAIEFVLLLVFSNVIWSRNSRLCYDDSKSRMRWAMSLCLFVQSCSTVKIAIWHNWWLEFYHKFLIDRIITEFIHMTQVVEYFYFVTGVMK